MEPLEKLFDKLGDDDQPTAFQAYHTLLKMVLDATKPGKEAWRAEVAGALVGGVNATKPGGKDKDGKDKPPVIKYTHKVRAEIIRLLSYVATSKEVPALVEATKQLELREMARYALDRNTSDEATDALIAALDDVGSEYRIGVIGALAKRRGAKVVSALQEVFKNEDRWIRGAALEALANFPDASSDALMVKVTKGNCMPCRALAHRARARLANTLSESGDKTAARRIFQSIQQSDADEPQKKAAQIGLKALG